MSDITNGILSDYCYNKMWDLFRTPEDEVGSEFKGLRKNRAITNCVIYVFNVLSYGHSKVGKTNVVAKLKELFPRQDGMQLAKYLTTQAWKSHYWNPDVWQPKDGQSEHIVSYKQVLETSKYYGVPVDGLIVGYNKQVKTKKETVWIPTIPTPIGTIPLPITVETSTENRANLLVFEDLKKVKFAVGINKGGTHCFLMSYGEVLEVHWDQEGAKLYGKTSFYGYEWNSGIILTPPDSSFISNEVKG
jgi:hypothetical protein